MQMIEISASRNFFRLSLRPVRAAIIHRHFAAQRVNPTNLRGELFYAAPSAVRDALVEHRMELVEYQEIAPSEELITSDQLREATQLTNG